MNERISSSQSRNDYRKEIRELVKTQLQTLLAQHNYEGAKALLIPVQPVDIAEAIEGLPEAMQAIAFRLLSKEEAIEVYEYFPPSVQQILLKDFQRQDVLDIVEQMSPDDRARLFEELPAKVVRRLLIELSPQERDATNLLLGYKPNTAGRIMTPEYLSLKEHLTLAQALERIRTGGNASETVYYLYVTDDARRLIGVLSLQELVMAEPEQTIDSVMSRDVVFVHTDADQEEVAHTIQRYDLLALPVVDSEQRLVGIITVDDALDVVEQETTEDIYALGGLESGGDYFQTNLFTVARRRGVWLLVLLVTNTATTAVIRSHEDVLEQVVALAAFIPLLIDTGGNVGAQSSTVVIRGLNTREVIMSKALSIMRREAIAGALLGVMLGLVVTVWAFVLQGNWAVASTVGISLFAISFIASVSGSALPFLFHSFGLDPALMSAPFITTAVDVLGVLIYLNMAKWILRL